MENLDFYIWVFVIVFGYIISFFSLRAIQKGITERSKNSALLILVVLGVAALAGGIFAVLHFYPDKTTALILGYGFGGLQAMRTDGVR